MNFSDILHWALNAAKDQAQKAAIAEVQKAALNLSDQISKHAPDMQDLAQSALRSVATTAVAGIMSRKN